MKLRNPDLHYSGLHWRQTKELGARVKESIKKKERKRMTIYVYFCLNIRFRLSAIRPTMKKT